MRATALQIASGQDPDARAPTEGPADLGEVATTFNHMLDELDRQRASTAEALEAARSFSASVAHEMRTPLTGMRAALDVLDRNPELTRAERDDIVHALLAQHERVTATMTALEQLAQSDLGHTMPSEAVHLADIADAVAQDAQTLYPNATIELHVDARAPCCDGSSDGLRLAMSNLIANAARHAPARPGGISQSSRSPHTEQVRVRNGKPHHRGEKTRTRGLPLLGRLPSPRCRPVGTYGSKSEWP